MSASFCSGTTGALLNRSLISFASTAVSEGGDGGRDGGKGWVEEGREGGENGRREGRLEMMG